MTMAKTYRVFLSRHYISVEFFDVEADSQAKAERAAEVAARHLYPEMRAVAADNGWHADKATEILHLGYSSVPFKPELVYRTTAANLYQDLKNRRFTRIGGRRLPEPRLGRL